MDLIKNAKRVVSNILTKKVVIPSYEEKRFILDHYRKHFNTNVLVETGTFFGDTIEHFKNSFEKLYSIELSADLAARAQKRFENNSKIQILQGDSGELLADIVSKLNKPALFWLDGHYSSEFHHNGEFIRTARTDKDTPVEKEIETLMKSNQPHVILIDDARLFTGKGDYPTVSKIRKKITSSSFQYKLKVEKDIIIITPQR
jgi:hypothetical protein